MMGRGLETIDVVVNFTRHLRMPGGESAVERSDLRLDTWYLQDRSTRLRVTHLPTGVSVEETEPDPKTPVIRRFEKLVEALAAKVDGIHPGGSSG